MSFSQRHFSQKLLPGICAEPEVLPADAEARLLRERAEEEAILAPVISQTFVTNASYASKKRKSGGDEAVDAVCLAPPLPAREELENTESAGVLFAATYANSAMLGKTLGRLKKFIDNVPLLFNKNGLEMCFLDRSRVTQPRVVLPQASFLRFEGMVAKKVLVSVPTQALLKFAAMCTPNHTLTFMYDQRGDKGAKLHLMLYPRDLNLRTEQKIRLTLPTVEDVQQPIEPNNYYQFAVKVSPTNFSLNVKRLEAESTTLRIALRHNSFDMVSVNDQGNETLTLETFRVHNEADMTSKTCLIQYTDRESPITPEMLVNYRISSTYLASISNFADVPECAELVIRLGGVIRPDNSVSEQPLHLRYKIGDGAGAYYIDSWLATRVNE